LVPTAATPSEKKKKNYAGSKTLPASTKEKETHWLECRESLSSAG